MYDVLTMQQGQQVVRGGLYMTARVYAQIVGVVLLLLGVLGLVLGDG